MLPPPLFFVGLTSEWPGWLPIASAPRFRVWCAGRSPSSSTSSPLFPWVLHWLIAVLSPLRGVAAFPVSPSSSRLVRVSDDHHIHKSYEWNLTDVLTCFFCSHSLCSGTLCSHYLCIGTLCGQSLCSSLCSSLRILFLGTSRELGLHQCQYATTRGGQSQRSGREANVDAEDLAVNGIWLVSCPRRDPGLTCSTRRGFL